MENNIQYRDKHIYEPKYLNKRKKPPITEYSDEELILLIEDDVLIKMKCESCEHDESLID